MALITGPWSTICAGAHDGQEDGCRDLVVASDVDAPSKPGSLSNRKSCCARPSTRGAIAMRGGAEQFTKGEQS